MDYTVFRSSKDCSQPPITMDGIPQDFGNQGKQEGQKMDLFSGMLSKDRIRSTFYTTRDGHNIP